MPKSIGRKGIIAIVLALIAVIGVASLAFFTDRVDHSMQFTTASFSADGYKLTRTAPEGPFCAGEEVTATLKESNTGDDDVNSIISMKATWVSPDTALSIFGNANAADNAKLSIDGTDISYKVSTDKKSITFDLPKQVLAAGTKDAARDLTLTIPASFKSTGRIEFTFEKVVVAQEGGGFSKEYSRTDLNAASDLDYSVKVGWAASSIEAQNGKALMGYLTDKNASGKFGIEFELAFNYAESPMKDFSSRTGAKWSYYKGAVDRLTFVEGMTTIGDYAFPDFSAVKSVSFPTTVKTIGLSAFDASGLTGTVTIPATVKEIKSLAFGNLPNVKTFTFGHTTDSLTLPDNTAAGKRNTGAFYVPTHVDTTVNTTVEAIMYGYKWHDGYDNRRLVPTLNAQDTWFRTYTSGSNYTAKLDENVLETITFADYHMPVTGETSWDASDPSVPGTVTAFLSADKKSLILAGNGYGLIFANEDSSGAFSSLTALKSVSNTDLLDTRNATTMANMFNFDKALANISVTTWNVSKVTDMSNMFYCCDSLPSIDLRPNTCAAKDGSGTYTAWNTASLKKTSGMFMDYGGENHALTTVDTTGWDTSKLEDTSYMFMECRGLTAVKGIESWNVSSLKDANNMFQDCQSLQTINVSNWNTASLENTSVMFGSCKALKSIDISKWDMSKVTKSNAMFVYCESFTELTLPKSLVVIGERFAGYCPKLTTITFNHPAGANIQMSSSAFIVENNGKDEGTTGYIEYTPVKPLGTKVVTSNQTVLDYDWTSDHRGYVVEIKTVEGGTLTGTPLATYNGRKAVVAINGKTITFTATATGDYVYDGATVQYSQGGTAKTVTLDKNTKTWVMPVVDDKVTEADVVVTPKWKVTAIPMLAKEDTWQYNGTDTNGDPTTPIDYDLLETINIVNKYAPAAGETSWDASANQTVDGVEYKGKVTVYLSADKKTLTISGNGYGKVFANPDSMWAMTKSRDGMSALKQISGANILDTQLVVNAGGMFAQNRKLESVDVSNWNTGKIQNTSAAGGYYGMFMNCAKLKVLDVSKWDTKSMTEMIRMFSGCETITKLDVSGWKTSKVTHMNEMFSGTGISQIAVNGSGWDTSNLVKSYNMFEGCANLTQINLSTWNVSKLEDTSEMFADSGLTSIDLSMWDESIVNSVYGMFRNCKALTSVNLNGWNLSNLEDGTTDNRKGSAGMFSGCTSLTELNIPASLKVFGQNFAANCTSLNKITFLHDAGTVLTFPTAGATYGAFYVDPAMKTTQIVGQNTSAKAYSWVKDQRAAIPTLAAQNTWYKGTTAKSAITGIEIVDSYSGASTESWDASAAQDGSVKAYINGTKLIIAGNGYGKVLANADSTSAFNAFTNVTSFTGLNKLDTSNVTNMQTMFNNLDNIQTLDLSSFNTSKVTNFYSIFGGNDKLTTLNLTGWDTSAAKDMGQMFYVCNALTTINGLSSFNTANVTDMSGMFHGCKAMTSLDLSNFNTAKVKTLSMMFYQCSNLETVKLTSFDTSNVTSLYAMFQYCYKLKTADLSSFNTAKVTNMYAAFDGCHKLQEITLGKDFKFVGTDGYLPTPSSTYIPQADGNWYVKGLTTHYTPAELAAVTRVRAVTYSAIPGTDPGTGGGSGGGGGTLEGEVRWPVQSGALTYNGNAQSPSWSGYDSSKMTIGGTTSGTNAGTYTATFTPKDGYCWPDGTADTVSVTWKIGKAAGSLFVTPTEMTIALNDTTGTITVARAGDGAITATSDKTSVATVEVNGNKITVTKKDAGTANITVKVAEGTNHKAPTGKTVVVTCKTTPELNAKNTWYTGSTAKSAITEIELKDSYTATGNEIESWDASAAQNKTVMAYVVEGTNGKKLILAGNGSGKIVANADSTSAFNGFTALTAFTGLNKLDTSNVTNMQTMFNNLDNIQTLDLSSFNTAKVTNFRGIFGGDKKLTTLNLTGWDTSAAKDMGEMFYRCNALTTISGLSKFNTAHATDMSGMFQGCTAMTALDLSNFNTANVKTMGMMFYQCSNLETVKLTSFDTSNVTNLYAMFQYCSKLKTVDLSSFNTSAVTNMSAAFDGCQTLQTVTLGKDFKFVGTDGYLPAPSATYISGADGNWYVAGTDTGYTPAELAAVTRVRAVTYSAIPGTDPGTGGGGGDIPADMNLAVPEQVGTLTANGSEQSPTWKNYDSSKMTISGTTSAVEAGTYTVTFTLNDGYAWFDGTAEDKDVQWKMESGAPMLAASSSWYKGSVLMSKFTKIELIDSGTPSGTIVEQWNADVDNSGSIKAYITGSSDDYTLTIAGNGSGSIMANPDSTYLFSSEFAFDFPKRGAFAAVTDITGIELLDTSKATHMSNMFIGCSSLTSLDVSGFDTSNVTGMSNMFTGCSSLTSLDVSGFNTSQVTSMSYMFHNCTALTSLDLSKFDTANVTSMSSMFQSCNRLTSLDLSGFDTSNVTSMSSMFNGCTKLKSVTLGKDFKFVGTNGYLPTPSATYISGADGKWYDSDTRTGYTPSGLASVTRNAPVTYVAVKPGPMLAERRSWYKSTKVTDKRLFKTIAIINSGKPSGTIVEQWNADVDNSGSIKAYITGSSGSYTLTIAGDGSGSIMANPDSNYAFSNTGVVSFSNVTSFTGTKLLNTSRVTDMSYMFDACSALTSLDVSGFDTSRVTDMSYMFSGCSKLTSLDVSGFDTSKVADMRGTFYDCTQLKSLDVSGFDTSSVTDMYGMFGWCKALTSLDLSGFDTSSVKEMYGMFYMCSALTSLDVSGFDTSKITNMRAMFSNCSALTSLDLSGFDTSKVTTMDNMFRDCTKLKSVTLGKDFKFVGTGGYLPTPSATYISGADGKWYDTNTGTGYTPETLATVERTEAVTYSAVPNAKILSGMWKFNKGLGLSRYDINANVPFKSAGKTFSSIYVPSKTANLCFDGKNTYLEGTGWTDAAYRLISFNGPQVVTEEFYNWFVENAKPVVTLEGKWKFNETLTFDTEVEATEISYTMDGFTGALLETEYAESGKYPGWKLAVDYNVFSDMYVYADTGLALLPLGWRDESYRLISFNGTQYVTKDFYDWFIANAKPWSEDESGAAEKIAVPKQSGTLTYNGNAQSPSWSNYDASKMTMGGTTTGTNAGSYTTTFALNDGFKWADGTTGTKSVIWKIGKATGSVSFSKDSLNIDKNSTTDTLDVTRTGTGAITATSSDTSVATVTVNGTKVTVTKVGDGTATITVKVAADANYKEASKTCSVTCVGIPTLAYGSTWYKGSTDKASITKIQIKDSYTPSGTAAESWNADARNSGSIKAYVEGTTLTIAGNGTGKIKANALSWSVFNGFSSAAAITGLDLMDTSNTLTMEAMFYGCKALTSLDLSKFDTSNVTSMRAMFYECENLTSLNVSKFDTASVTNVEAMFQGCKALTAVGDVSGWNTAKVTSMYQVFYGCEKLTALDLSGWNTTNVTNMQAMFLDCTSLTSVGDISGWNTAKVTEMALLFGNCEKLASLDVSKFNTAAVTNMNAMFFNCSALTTLDVSSFDTAKTTNLAAMFSGCVSLTSLDVSNWNTGNVTTMEATFQNCKKLTTMGDVSGWDTSKVTNMREMFCQCNLITSVDVTNWKTGNVTNMNGIFSNCEKLTSVGDLSGWDTSSATDMGWIFNSCFKLTGMGDISQWDTSNATKMNCLFATCESLTELDLSGWDTSKVTDMNNIFGGYEHEQLEEGEIAGACVLLRKITLGAKFKFVGTDSYLPEPDSRYISGADGKWYAGSTGYTPAELAGLSRTEAVTYVAVKGTKTMSILSGDNAVSGYSISE